MSNEFRAIYESFNLTYDENSNHCAKPSKAKRVVRRRMSGKFQFKPPSSRAVGKSVLNVKSCPSVHPPKPDPPKGDDDLWNDDIDEDMLIEASQMAENEVCKADQERMEIGPDALQMFIQEEEYKNDDWSSQAPANRFNQTSTILQKPTKASGLSSHPIKSPRETNCTKNAPPPNKGPHNEEQAKQLIEEMNRIRNENKTLAQKHQAKAGEISFLRNELARRQKEIDLSRKECQKIREQRAQELKHFESEKKAVLVAAQSKMEFMQRELDQTTETLLQLKKKSFNGLPNGGNTVNHKKILDASQSSMGPPSKRPRQSVPPSNIDESFFSEEGEKLPRATKDVEMQTVLNPKRSYVITQVHTGTSDYGEKGSLATLMSYGDQSSKFLKAPHPSSKLHILANLLRQKTSELRQCDNIDESVVLCELSNARIVVDHLPSIAAQHGGAYKTDVNDIIHDLFAMPSLKAFDGKVHVLEATFSFLCAIIQHDTLGPGIDPQLFVTLSNEAIRKLQADGDSSITTFIGVLECLVVEPSLISDRVCQNSNDACLPYSVWSFISQLNYEKLSSQSKKQLGVAVLRWVSTNLSRTGPARIGKDDKVGQSRLGCNWCRGDIIKVLSTITWLIVDHLVHEESSKSEFFQLAKVGLICSFQVFSNDPVDFVRGLVESPAVQRRYIWTTRQLSRIKGNLKLTSEQELILQDLDMDITAS